MIPARRPRLFYGWVVVAVAFVTMGVAINARTGFSLLFPEIVDEFGWDAGTTAGAFSVGFLASTAFLPVVGWMMGRWGPRVSIPMGAALVAAGYLSVRWATAPVHLYLSFGLLAVAGSMAMSYIGHAMFLPNWFVRRRGLATGIAFSGVGAVGALLLPAMQRVIDADGWRAACLAMAVLVVVAVIPLNALFQRTRPEDMGLFPDGETEPLPGEAPRPVRADAVVDAAWVGRGWTLGAAIRTARFWWLSLAFFCSLFISYSILIHQTRHLIQAGFDAATAAGVLGATVLFGVGGQIGLGALSDRIGREIAWTLGLCGYVGGLLLLIRLGEAPSAPMLWALAAVLGLVGAGLAALYGAIPAEIFGGPRYASIFTAISLLGNLGAAGGVFLMGVIHDATGDYRLGFQLCIGLAGVSAVAVWAASPRKVRLVAGAAERRRRAGG